MRRCWSILIVLLTTAAINVSDSSARTVSWSGYTWQVRPTGPGPPEANQWSDAPANVSVNNEVLRLAITPSLNGWQSAEVHLERQFGYGRYRWVVATNLDGLDPQAVLGLFTYDWQGGVANSEIDIEATRWGSADDPTSGEFSVQPADAGQQHRFSFNDNPPYTCDFTWRPGEIAFAVHDAAGLLVASYTSTTNIFAPSANVWPSINLWLNRGNAPVHSQAVDIAVEIASFSFTPEATLYAGQGLQPPLVSLGDFAWLSLRRGSAESAES